MMIDENLTEENFLLQCAKHYKNTQCQSTEEFLSDLQHVKYIKKLLTRYNLKKTIDERLILNHLIILNNIFGPTFLTKIIFLKMLPQISQIKPFLVYLNLLPDTIENVNGKDHNALTYEMDWYIVERLRVLDKNSKSL
jgi:hypothetical protein